MFSRPEVKVALGRFVLARLYTDGDGDMYARQQAYQQSRFGTIALPLYAIVTPSGDIVDTFPGLTRSPREFLAFLDGGNRRLRRNTNKPRAVIARWHSSYAHLRARAEVDSICLADPCYSPASPDVRRRCPSSSRPSTRPTAIRLAPSSRTTWSWAIGFDRAEPILWRDACWRCAAHFQPAGIAISHSPTPQASHARPDFRASARSCDPRFCHRRLRHARARARDSVRFAELARSRTPRLACTRIAKPKPRFEKRRQQRAYAVAPRASRHASARAARERDSALVPSPRAISSVATSRISALVARDAFVRDSVATARRWATHVVADDIEEWLTGTRGISATRIAYVTQRQAARHRLRRHARPRRTHRRAGDVAVVAARRRRTGCTGHDRCRHRGRLGRSRHRHDPSRSLATKRGLEHHACLYAATESSIVFTTADPSRPALVAVAADSGPRHHSVGGARSWEADEPTFNPDGSRIAYVSPRPSVPQIYSSKLDGTR